MTALVATRITTAIAGRLAVVRTAAGYVSDIGARVLVGQLSGSAPMAPCIYVIPGPQKPGETYGPVCQVTRTISIRAFVDANSHPTRTDTEMMDILIWDIRKAMESTDATLGGIADGIVYRSDSPGYREDGGSLIGVGMTYEVTYTVSLTDPTTAL